MDTRTDDQLVRAARSNDKAAFGLLIERYMSMVQHIAQRMVRDIDIAHELAQEAVLQAFLSLADLRSEERFRSWLYGISLNVCRTYIRSQRTDIYSLDAMLGGVYYDAIDNGPTRDEIAERLELRRAVMKALETLSPANRTAVMLFYFEGFSLQEASAQLGISVTALKGRLHKARRQLEASLLPMYSPVNRMRGASTMISVKIVDVMRQQSLSDSGAVNTYCQVILLDEANRRAIIIWMSEPDAMAITQGLNHYETPRPMTHVFLARLLEATGAVVESVTISTLQDEVFYAMVNLITGTTKRTVDARPSDGLALAVQTNAPIFVSEEIMQQVGQPIPVGQTPTCSGMAGILAYLDTQNRTFAQKKAKHESKTDEQRKQESEQGSLTILSNAFGPTT
jgi:RNA polymerase sigma factor (sigma-70 family)